MIKTIAVLMPLFASLNWALVYLLAGKSGNIARFYLGFFMWAIFAYHVGIGLYYMGEFRLYFHYEPIMSIAGLSMIPFFYQFIRLLTIDAIWRPSYILDFIPAFLFGILTLWVHQYHHDIVHLNIEQYYLDDLKGGYSLTAHPVSILTFFEKGFFIVQIFFYIVISRRLIIKHRERILDFYSNTENKKISWIAVLTVVLIVGGLLSIVFTMMGVRIFFRNPTLLLFPSFLDSLVLFLIGFLGFSQRPVVVPVYEEEIKQNESSGTDDRKDPEIKPELETLFVEDKLYLKPDLTIWDVTSRLHTNRTYVSNYINQVYGVNFSQFVNRYRVEAVKKMLCDQDSARFSLETIGELCGFGSLNNFIRVFRASENMTPGQFREKCRKLCEPKMHPPSGKPQ